MKRNLILWVALVLVGFLAGFIPQYAKARQASGKAADAMQQLNSCQARVSMAQIRDLATMLYLEATRQNYGTAAEYSNRLFERVRQELDKASDPNLKATLTEVVRSRDTITAGLAKGDSAVINELQPIIAKLQETSR